MCLCAQEGILGAARRPGAFGSTGNRRQPMGVQSMGTERINARNVAQALRESSLIRRSQEGEVAAFGELVETYQDRILAVCVRTIGNRSAAEDIAQEAFVRAFTSIRRFDGRAAFYTWLFRIAMNLCLSELRKKRHGVMSLDGARAGREGPALANHRDRGMGPSAEAELREEHQRVVEALDKLDAEHRAVVILRDMESLDYAEIAEILEVPVGTVKSRLHRARCTLREMLQPLLGQDRPDA